MWAAAWVVIAAEVAATGWLLYLYSRGVFYIFVDRSSDVATLALTAAAVVVTGVGVAVAVVTIWGFKEIKRLAIKAAVKEARKQAREVAVAATERAFFAARTSDIDVSGRSDGDDIAGAIGAEPKPNG